MDQESRGNLTLGLWFLSAVVLAALFIAAAAQGDLTSAHVALAVVMLTLATAGTVAIWRWQGEAEEEKAKRRRLDVLLHDLSDDELAELKHRLTGGDSDKAYVLDDDGELRRSR